jgi:hypothetical protein
MRAILCPLYTYLPSLPIREWPLWHKPRSGRACPLCSGRLARGLPFTSVDHYEVDEVRQLTRAVDQIMRSLKLLILVVLIGMVALVVALPLQKAIETNLSANGRFWVGCVISGFIGLTLSYVCSRMWQVIRGDQELTTLQSAFVVRAVERKQAKRFEDQISSTEAVKFKAPDGYGNLIN